MTYSTVLLLLFIEWDVGLLGLNDDACTIGDGDLAGGRFLGFRRGGVRVFFNVLTVTVAIAVFLECRQRLRTKINCSAQARELRGGVKIKIKVMVLKGVKQLTSGGTRRGEGGCQSRQRIVKTQLVEGPSTGRQMVKAHSGGERMAAQGDEWSSPGWWDERGQTGRRMVKTRWTE
jgi:hypothetical protein